MSNLKKRFNEIMLDIEKNIKNKEDLEYIKSQVYSISMLFLDEIDKLAELNLGRLNVMMDREKELNKRITTMERIIRNIEEELFVSQEDEGLDFEILCPYCNTEFVEDFTNGFKHEVTCPECDNLIELDWHGECECGHECDGKCSSENEKIEKEIEDEDDM